MKTISNITDQIFQDNNYPDGIKVSEIALTTNEIFYNFTTGEFGYGDDARDFHNNGDDAVIVDSLYLEDDGSITIEISAEVMDARIAQYLFEHEDANETINIYYDKTTGVLTHTWGSMEYRDDIHELVFQHQYVLDYDEEHYLSDYEDIVEFNRN